MKSSLSLTEALTQFIAAFIEQYQEKHRQLPLIQSDDDWLSPCETDSPAQDGNVYWQPVTIEDELSFENVEQALSVELHSDFKTYFAQFYSETLPATSTEGHLSLLFAWNKDDFERLQQNIIGHILMKQKLKQPLTLFFAVTDEEDFILTLDNQTGAIWVEQVGCLPNKKLADSMAEFISQLTPFVDEPIIA